MLLQKAIAISIASQLALLPSLAQAQSSDFDRAFAQQGAEARVSFTIPLGHSSEKTKTSPRFGFAVRNYQQTSTQSWDWMRADAAPYREVQLGFTLEGTPKLMMNDEVLVIPEGEQANIGTAGKIGIGVVAVALVAVAAVGVLLVDCDNKNCWDED